MTASKKPRADGKKPAHRKKDRAAEIANTFEWLITAFILAFVFRAFVMEAFRIPTGSMADTLMGAHFLLRCSECGYRYEYGFVPRDYDQREDTIPPGPVSIAQRTRCPSCGYRSAGTEAVPVANGDRILVLKCIYQFFEPKRWDVVVFKNPENPSENYIKRLIGLPGDEIEIIDGDVYIDGQIARKPPEVQQELWMPVYDHDYRPVNPNERGAYNERGVFNGERWQAPFNFDASEWQMSAANPTQLELDCPSEPVRELKYDAPSANDFRVAYAYNYVRMHEQPDTPLCGDLMVRFYVQPGSDDGRVGVALSRQGIDYKAWLDFSGEMVVAKVENGEQTILDHRDVSAPPRDAFILVKFAYVDRQLLFECNGDVLPVDLGRSADTLDRITTLDPHAALLGSGKLTLSHLAIYRDLYYTGDGQSSRQARAVEHRPFTLHEDEFFVLGDNSPNSQDGRWWQEPGKCCRGWDAPRAGVVPRYYMVGKALFVYWPSGFEFPWPRSIKTFLLRNSRSNLAMRLLHGIISLRWIPNVGRMRFIYGGAEPADEPPRAHPDSS